jgi:hypothetical protein
MTLALFAAAIRRHPFSTTLTLLLVLVLAPLFGVAALLALAVWVAATCVAFELWSALEPFVLRRFVGLRAPSHAELEVLDPILVRHQLRPLISDSSDLAFGRGFKCLVVSRDVLDVLEERALSGLLTAASLSLHRADRAGVLLVWLGSLPLIVAWLVSRGIGQLGRLLGVVIGQSLVVPVVLWPGGFVRWSGRVLGLVFVGLLGAMLVTSGLAGAGAALLVGWAAIPALDAVLAWERRRLERAADRATIDAGLGSQLLEALEFLVLAEPRTTPSGPLGFVCPPGAPLTDRADRIRRRLSTS